VSTLRQIGAKEAQTKSEEQTGGEGGDWKGKKTPMWVGEGPKNFTSLAMREISTGKDQPPIQQELQGGGNQKEVGEKK